VTRSTGIERVVRDRSFDGPARLEGSDVEKLAKSREIRDLIEEKIKVWVVEQVSAR
jgi:hypothetical protein